MKKTSNYNLNLYEVNDLANLTDGYNNSMTTLDTTVKTVSNSVSAETTRATKAEATLTTNLNSEITRAKAAESTLTTNLNAEVTRAKNVESTLTTNLNAEVTRAKLAEDTLKVVQIANPSGTTYTSTIVITDKIGLIDCGTGMVAPVVNFMKENGYSKFDYIVFTHMHADHIEKTTANLGELKTYVPSGTPIYIQMAPQSSFEQYSQYTQGLTAAKYLGATTVPSDGSTLTFGNTKVTFFNTNSNNISAYNSYGDLNIFSLVTRIDYSGSSYVDTGDIYLTAQKNYLNVGNCDILKWPHHGVNYWDSYNFISQFSPKSIIASPSDNGSLYSELNQNHYIYRWCNQVVGALAYVQSKTKNTTYTVKYGHIATINAVNFAPSAPNAIQGFFNVDADTSDTTDAWKTWTLSEFMSKTSNVKMGDKIVIGSLSSLDGVQFAMQLYAFSLGVYKNESSISASECVTCVRDRYINTTTYNFFFSNRTHDAMSIYAPYEASIGALPTFTSLSDVVSKYKPSNYKTTSVKTLVGSLYDTYGAASGMPVFFFNGLRTNAIYGSYYVGKHSWADFAKMGYVTGSWSNSAPKSVCLICNTALDFMTAGSYYYLTFAGQRSRYTTTFIDSNNIYTVLMNSTHMQIFKNGNTRIYDSATDTESLSVVSIM